MEYFFFWLMKKMIPSLQCFEFVSAAQTPIAENNVFYFQ